VRTSRGKVVILSKNSSSLFVYADALNKLGFYTLSLCNQVSEVMALLDEGRRYEYLLYDALDSEVDAHSLQAITKYRSVATIIAIADANSRQRQSLLLWAKTHKIPLRGILQKPLRRGELREFIEYYLTAFD